MQKPKIFGVRPRALFAVAAAAALSISMIAAPATAADESNTVVARATLASAPAKTSSVVIDNLTWTCDGASCTGVTTRALAESSHWLRFDRGCKAVAAALGPLSAYSHRGRAATASALAKCNAG